MDNRLHIEIRESVVLTNNFHVDHVSKLKFLENIILMYTHTDQYI